MLKRLGRAPSRLPLLQALYMSTLHTLIGKGSAYSISSFRYTILTSALKVPEYSSNAGLPVA